MNAVNCAFRPTAGREPAIVASKVAEVGTKLREVLTVIDQVIDAEKTSL